MYIHTYVLLVTGLMKCKRGNGGPFPFPFLSFMCQQKVSCTWPRDKKTTYEMTKDCTFDERKGKSLEKHEDLTKMISVEKIVQLNK